MADRNEYLLRKFHATGNVTYNSLDNVLKTLQNPESDYGTIVTQMYNATKQLDSLRNDMDPVFSLIVPVPKKQYGTVDTSM